jgi:hypothetical protein
MAMMADDLPEVATGDLVTDASGQLVVITEAGDLAPLVGELSDKTTPADFARFAAQAAAWWKAHDPSTIWAA